MNIQQILSISEPAICGTFEKEISVKASDVMSTKRMLKKAGFIIVGTGRGSFGKTKIWFNPAGVNL